MAQRFVIEITKRQAWYYYSMHDLRTDKFHTSSKGYNSEGGAKEAAQLLADKVMSEQEPNIYYYGPEI